MFAVYFSAVTSISNKDCKAIFDEPKGSLLAKFHLNTQRALIKARLLKSSDLAVLQAFVLFVVSRSVLLELEFNVSKYHYYSSPPVSFMIPGHCGPLPA